MKSLKHRALYITLCIFAAVAITRQVTAISTSVSREVDAALGALAQGKLEEAAAALHRARFSAPDEPHVLYDLGIVAYNARRYDEAASLFNRVASSPTANISLTADALYNLGNAYYRSGKYKEAVEAYRASIARHDDPMARFNLEQALKKMHELEQKSAQSQSQMQNERNRQDKNDSANRQSDNEQPENQNGEGEQSESDRRQNKEQSTQNQQDKNTSEDQQKADASKGGEEQKNRDLQNKPESSEERMAASNTGEIGTASQDMKDEQIASKTIDEHSETAKLRDVDMGQNASETAVPDVSEKAKALKNQKLNPYLVEKILRQMEARERELQLRYRGDKRGGTNKDPFDELFEDPFFMDPESLRDFMEGRTGRRKQPQSDAPDW